MGASGHTGNFPSRSPPGSSQPPVPAQPEASWEAEAVQPWQCGLSPCRGTVATAGHQPCTQEQVWWSALHAMAPRGQKVRMGPSPNPARNQSSHLTEQLIECPHPHLSPMWFICIPQRQKALRRVKWYGCSGRNPARFLSRSSQTSHLMGQRALRRKP